MALHLIINCAKGKYYAAYDQQLSITWQGIPVRGCERAAMYSCNAVTDSESCKRC